MNWDEYFISLLNVIASKSKDPRTKVGAICVGKNNEILITGFNGFPIGVKDTKKRYNNRELKHKFVSHADSNCIYFAARNGIKLEGSRMYLPWYPCSKCAIAITQAGIKEVIIDGKDYDKNLEHWKDWSDDMKISKIILSEANVKLRIYKKR